MQKTPINDMLRPSLQKSGQCTNSINLGGNSITTAFPIYCQKNCECQYNSYFCSMNCTLYG
jgi:hypothetical protein